MKTTKADGVKGVLLRSINDRYFFRVYDRTVDPWGIKDYELRHSDLCVTICDADATLYEYNDDEITLDHNPETLGK